MDEACNMYVVEIITTYTVPVRKPEEKRLLWTRYCGRKKNSRVDIRKLEKDGFDSSGIRCGLIDVSLESGNEPSPSITRQEM